MSSIVNSLLMVGAGSLFTKFLDGVESRDLNSRSIVQGLAINASHTVIDVYQPNDESVYVDNFVAVMDQGSFSPSFEYGVAANVNKYLAEMSNGNYRLRMNVRQIREEGDVETDDNTLSYIKIVVVDSNTGEAVALGGHSETYFHEKGISQHFINVEVNPYLIENLIFVLNVRSKTPDGSTLKFSVLNYEEYQDPKSIIKEDDE